MNSKIKWFEDYFPRLLKQNYTDAIEEIKKLKSKAKLIKSFEDEGIANFAEGLLNRLTNRVSKVMPFYNNAMKLFRKSNSAEWIAALEHGIGHYFDLQGKYSEAENYYFSALKYYNENRILKREAMVSTNLGRIYQHRTDKQNSLKYYNRAYRIFMKLKDNNSQAAVLNNIGSFYESISDYPMAFKMYNDGLKIFFQLKDAEKIAGNLTNLAAIRISEGKYNEAKKYLLEAEKYTNKITFKYIAINIKINLGRVFTELGDFKNADLNLTEALQQSREINDIFIVVKSLETIGELHLKKNDSKTAAKYFSEALEIASKYKYRSDAILMNKNLSEISESECRYFDALQYFKNYHKIHTEVYNENTAKATAELKAEFEKIKAEKDAEILRLKNFELKRQIEAKSRELNSAANYIVQKNDFVNEIIKEIKSHLNRWESDKSDKNSLIRHLEQVERKQKLNDELVHFEDNLNKMNLTFIEKLGKKYPLTRIELKLCSLMKINLSTKEIAKLLSVSHRTIETHRHHIIQKLKLPKGKSLYSFINNL